MAKLTITTTTYNRSDLLPRAIESVLNQSFNDFEYIIINNGSTDNTQEIIEKYMRQDSRIKCIKMVQNSLKQTKEQEKLFLETSDNIYYTKVDDDDWIHKDMINTLYHLAIETGSDICSVGSKYVFPDGSETNKYVYDGQFTLNRVDAMLELLKREKINSSSGGKLYKKHICYCLDLPKVPRIRDIHNEYRRMNRINKMTITGVPLYYFYRHDGNVSGLSTKKQITPEMLNEHLLANRIRTEYLSEKMPEITDYVLYCEYSFMLSLTTRIFSLEANDCFPIAFKMRNDIRKKTSWLEQCGFLSADEILELNSIKKF